MILNEKIRDATTVCWCGGDLEMKKDGYWYVQKCKQCGWFVSAYMVFSQEGISWA
jgi:hypothetical protein